MVGEFNATDPDANATLTYHLVPGAGDTHNALFTLETNGTLKTATVFDYESNASTYTVRVQVKDEHNASVEGNFTVTLTDILYEPSPQPNHLVDLNSTVNLEMIWVEPGTFTMGSPSNESGRSSNEIEHSVTLTKGFYLGKYEVTQAQYEAVMEGNGNGLSATPSQFGGYPNSPVEKVSHNDIQIFLQQLNDMEAGNLLPGWTYVLPSEAQWEYAGRAGTNTKYSWGDSISSVNANYDQNNGKPVEVGQYTANSWGFFDMHGNVSEWTADWYTAYDTVNNINPEGPNSGSERVDRGGSWRYGGSSLRAANRGNSSTPGFSKNSIGFRLALRDLNKAPTDLNSTAPLTIAENQPIGAIVGEFNATDPDANATLTYHLVSGAGDGNNSLFSLETNGTLKTATIFDFESNAPTYAIRVQTKDEHNASVEGNFTVTLTDDDEPFVMLSYEGNATAQVDALENQPFGAFAEAFDPEGLPISYAITGGTDQGLFEINASSGVVSFKSPADFENPNDADGDNRYEVQVLAQCNSQSLAQNYLIQVVDVQDSALPANGYRLLATGDNDHGQLGNDGNVTSLVLRGNNPRSSFQSFCRPKLRPWC